MTPVYAITSPQGEKVTFRLAKKPVGLLGENPDVFSAKHTSKSTQLFLLLAAYMLWTYSVMPDVQTSLVAIKTGVGKQQVQILWALSLAGTAVFFYALYRVGETPG